MRRDDFLQRLRARLDHSAGSPAPPAPHPRPEPRTTVAADALEPIFVARLEELGVRVARCASREEAERDVERTVTARGWQAVCGLSGLRTPALAGVWVDDPRAAEFGLAEADWAIAATGTVVLLNGGEAARGHSLLPPASGFVIEAQRILPCLGDALRLLAERADELPACVSFVSGPSNTTDINATRCVGVHGPGEVFAWIVAGK